MSPKTDEPMGSTRGGSRLVAALVLLAAVVVAPPASAHHLSCQGNPTTIDGTSANDTIAGTPGDDVINADAGNDRVEGNGGNDLICGGDGNDRLTSGAGVDRLDGGTGNDRLSSGDENDVLFGGPGADRLFGDAGIDAFIGGPGDDQLRGGGGFADQAQYFDSPNGVDANLTTGIAIGQGTDSLFDIQQLVGSNFDDTLVGNAGSNNFIAMLGDDIIDGGAGFDGIENNFLFDPVTVDLGAGTVTGQGNDQLFGIESAGGTIGEDLLLGSEGPDSLTGRAGDDRIEGRGGNDDLAGNEGDDFLDGHGGFDTGNGGPDTDTCITETAIDCEAVPPCPVGDSFGYTCEAVPITYVEANTVLPLSGDDLSAQVSLPFPFTFYGQTYTTAHVSTNGFINFLAPSGAFANVIIPNTADPNAAIYVFWDDLFVDGPASVRTELLGAAPDRRFVVEWRNVHFFGDSTRRVDFEVLLFEDGRMLTQYRNIANDGRERGNSATIRIENESGTVALQYSMNTPSIIHPEFAVIYSPPAT